MLPSQGPSNRRILPRYPRGQTQWVTIGDYRVVLRTREYEDGMPGEISISVKGEEFKKLRVALGVVSQNVSTGLQQGIPLKKFVDQFVDSRSDISGLVKGYEPVRQASSIEDFVFRWLGIEYLGLKELACPVTLRLVSKDGKSLDLCSSARRRRKAPLWLGVPDPL